MRLQNPRSILLPGLLAALTAVWLVACSGVRPVLDELKPVPRPVVERTQGSVLLVRWPASYTLSAVKVFAGTAPNEIDYRRPVARTYGLDTAVKVRGLDPQKRYYLELWPDIGDIKRVVAERRLPLVGTDNFRDIGGYETTDGQVVRWGLLYRSNNLADLTNDDLRYLARLRVQLVCDFRSEPERTREPNRQQSENPPETAELSISVEGVDPGQMQERIRTGVSEAQLERIMINAYRSFVTEHSDQWAAMFERIAETANLPTIVHCTAGKDRTGFASAMILLALGVPEKTVFEDYMATNAYRANYNKWMTRVIPLYSLFRTSGEDLEALLDARRPYLQASLDAIHDEYGSVDAYLDQRLGVTAEKRAHLRETFLRRP